LKYYVAPPTTFSVTNIIVLIEVFVFLNKSRRIFAPRLAAMQSMAPFKLTMHNCELHGAFSRITPDVRTIATAQNLSSRTEKNNSSSD
jgi:hypothetical protein